VRTKKSTQLAKEEKLFLCSEMLPKCRC